ncbi:MAG: FAD-dependent oxidoreductase [Dehalobacterium sp.]
MNLEKYSNLFSSIKIGSMTLSNRIVLAPMATNFSTSTGNLTEKQLAYYVERAKGGVGLIISESNYVSSEGRGAVKRFGLVDDSMIRAHRKLTDAVHMYGCKICAQLHHAGVTAPVSAIGQYPVSCSSTILPSKGQPFIGVIPKTLSLDEINDLVKDFGQAARRAKEAGFDAVMVHGAHGYLINQFLSPHTNKRKDRYGDSPKNRMRFLLEIIDEVRKNVGTSFPIFTRLSAEENIDGGYSIDFIKDVVKEMQNHGVDEINLSCGNYEQIEQISPIPPYPEGCYVKYAEAVKDISTIPIGIVGRIKTPELAERIIAEGKADLIYLGRELIADPLWPQKALEGKAIRECIFCNRGCFDRMLQGDEIRCTVNYEVGREGTIDIRSVSKPKKVLVIGGGPAGMETSRVAALRGHKVTLIDQDEILGGQLNVASVPQHKTEIQSYIEFLKNELKNFGVNVSLNQKFSNKILKNEEPEVLVVATGAKPLIPSIPGVNYKHVFLAQDVFQKKCELGQAVTVIGGGLVGMEIAEWLVDKGLKITVVEMLDDVLMDVGVVTKKLLLQRVGEKGIKILLRSKVVEITDKGVVIKRLGVDQIIKGNSVVLAMGYVPQTVDLNSISDSIKTFVVGDAGKPGSIFQSIQEGAEVGWSI